MRQLISARAISPIFFATLAIAAALPGEASARSTAPAAQNRTPSVIRRLEALEDQCFQQKSRGEYAAALDTLKRALGIVFDEAGTGGPEVERELYAAGEVYLHLAFRLAGDLARHRELIPVLVQTPEDAPALRALADFLRLQCLLHAGKVEEAGRIRDRLGMITDWHLIGPFENERGGGFDTAYGPEESIDLLTGHNGKEREVFWRRNPVVSTTGYVNLNAIFKPNNQCLAYALCFIESDGAQDVCLRVGSDEALKVFLNGAAVHEIDARRQSHFDQDAVGLRLHQGKNALLLKICDRTGGWGFLARITGTDGRPAQGVRITTDDSDYTAWNAETAVRAEVAVDRGARDVFERLTDGGNAGRRSRPHIYLGLLHYFNDYEGEDSDKDTAQFEKFIADNPNHLMGHTMLAMSRLRPTEMATEKDDNPWRLGMEKTLEIDPQYADGHLMLARYYTYSLWVPAKARRHVEAALAINPAFFEARLLRARILDYIGLDILSREAILAMAGEGSAIEELELLGELGDIALAEGRNEEAKTCFRSIVGLDYEDRDAREALFDIAREEGDLSTMLRLLDERNLLHPYNTEVHLLRSDLLIAEERYDEAQAAIEEATGINPDDDRLWARLGRTHHLAGRDEQALALYEKALDLNPKSDKLRRYVEFLNETAAPFEDAFKRDALEIIAAHPAGDNPENNPHEYLLRQDVYRVNPDGTDSNYHHTVARILNERGAETFDVYYTTYALSEQRARIKTARVIHADGSIEEAKIDNRVLREYERGGYVPAAVDMPSLVPGDVVDLEYRVDGIKQGVFGNYFGLKHYFQDDDLQAVKNSELTLLLPREREFTFNKRFLDAEPEESASADGRFRILTWKLTDLPKIDKEPFMPALREFGACVEVSTYRDWDEMARWWWQLVEKQCDSSDALKSLTAELTRGCTTEREKIRAIYNFVVSEIRYNDTWEFGIHGFKPYRASAIVNNRFGDCKDKAILIRSMLSEVGVEALPVMIRLEGRRSREDLSLPLVNHFNHAIAYVPSIDGGPGIFLDGTAQYYPMDALHGGDQGATVVVVNEDGYEVKTIPYSAPGDNSTRTFFDTDLAADGSAVIRVANESTGTNEARERQRFLNPGKRENELKSAFGSIFGEVDIEDMRFSDMENLDAPVTYSFGMRVKDIILESGDFSGGNGSKRLRSSFFPLNLNPYSALDTRKMDLLLGAPMARTTRITYKLPGELAAERLPENVRLENDFAAFTLDYSADGGTITVERVFEVRSPRVPAEDYAVFRDFCREVEQAEKRMIHLRKV